MDSKKLKAFLVVKNLGSLTRAAEELNYTQSGMTHMMNALEKELGITLLCRGRNGVSLTPAGKRLLPKIEALVTAADALETELEQMHGARAPGIRIGAYSSMARHWLPEMVQRFRLEMPDAEITIQMGAVAEVYEMLKNAELDCALVSYQPSEFTGALEWIPLHNDELMAIAPEDFPVRGALFSVSDFEGQDFLMPADGFDLDISPVFAGNRVRPNIRYTNLDDPAIISMVEHGLGLSVLSELIMHGRNDRVQALPLTPPAYRQLGIALRMESQSDRLLQCFIAHARAAVVELYKA